MRLSDERLDEIDRCNETGAPHDENIGGGELDALIAEVRALRECEKALDHLFSRFTVYGDERGPDVGDVIAGQHAEAALAGVRALEDKP